MLLSVVVPVYNAELYLNRCLDSILNQTFQDFELIVVDDGSTDNTAEICDKYKIQYDNLKVIHQDNSGSANARKRGVFLSKGEYIAFVDSDDWIEPEYFEKLFAELQNGDVVLSGAIKNYDDGRGEIREINYIPVGIYASENSLLVLYSKMLCCNMPFEFGVLPYMCNKIFRKDILYPLIDKVDKRIFDGEDVAIVYPYLLCCHKIVLTDYCGYHYRIHSQSISHKKRKTEYYNEACLYMWLYEQFSNSIYCEMLIPQLNSYMLMMTWKRNPSMFIAANRFVFPYSKVPQGAAIIIYGDGDVGGSYYQELLQNTYCNVVAIADKRYCNASDGYRIEPKEIQGFDYDYIVIANADRLMCNIIKEDLQDLGIDSQKIIF